MNALGAVALVVLAAGCGGPQNAPGTPRQIAALHELPPVPAGKDVATHLSQFRTPNDPRILETVARLEQKTERPWTVGRLQAAFASASNDEDRAALIYLLAASRDRQVLHVVGEALAAPALPVRVAAAEGIVDYWLAEKPEGGTEQIIDAARSFWAEYSRKPESPR